MSKADFVAGMLWFGVTLYAVFGGADFGGGLWDLVAGGRERGERPRALIQRSIAPVWEANHVWLIFVLVILWTGFPEAFGAVMSTVYIPLALAAVGIVLRGSGFAFRKSIHGEAERAAGAAFAISSLLTPFFMGTVVGAVASGEVPAAGNGDPLTSWTGVLPLVTGVLFVVAGAYLAAVFLVRDARRAGRRGPARVLLAAGARRSGRCRGRGDRRDLRPARRRALRLRRPDGSRAAAAHRVSGLWTRGACAAHQWPDQGSAPGRGRRRRRGRLGLLRRPASLHAARAADDLRRGWHGNDLDHGDRDLRGRRTPLPSLPRTALRPLAARRTRVVGSAAGGPTHLAPLPADAESESEPVAGCRRHGGRDYRGACLLRGRRWLGIGGRLPVAGESGLP